MMGIFVAISSRAIMAIMAILSFLAIMAQLDMATNMPIIGVYGKNRKNVDHPRKQKTSSGKKL